MTDRPLRQSALAHLGLAARAVGNPGAAGVTLAEGAIGALIDLRGQADDSVFFGAVEGAAGVALPREANTTNAGEEATAFWLGPDWWWLLMSEEPVGALIDRLRDILAGQNVAVTDISETRARILVGGPHARDLLQKATPLDLHPRAFKPGRCAQSHLAKTGALIHQLSEDPELGPRYQLCVPRSFADYAWRWLSDAALEYGLAVVHSQD